jgi:hypothetical protein
MAETDEADDNRLIGRMPKAPRRDVTDKARDTGDDETGGRDDHEIDAVNRLLGFLRGTEEA